MMPDTKCKDCGSTEAYEFQSRAKAPFTTFWLCLNCLQKRAHAPRNPAQIEAIETFFYEFLDKGGKPS